MSEQLLIYVVMLMCCLLKAWEVGATCVNLFMDFSFSLNEMEGMPQGHDCNTPKATSGFSGDACISEQQEHLLPIANVGRIMKKVLPPNAKISKEAKETMQECASEFIGFITGEAADICHKDDRKSVNGDDICSAMKTLGLDYYANATRRYLHRYKEHEENGSTSKLINRNTVIDIVDELSISKAGSSGRSPMNRPRG
ncbi:nuclear transcription factor Y subunit B-1-like [Curcuma longa]|uniref:nuclear transcription factor Y subunit B-1-like n=1 Tax=Curcuma longa TaxID=136217 RepID=UPI003D9DF653